MENDDIAASTEAPEAATAAPADLIEELLVEEISIDGMCGVY
jgi:mycofactocin precursor